MKVHWSWENEEDGWIYLKDTHLYIIKKSAQGNPLSICYEKEEDENTYHLARVGIMDIFEAMDVCERHAIYVAKLITL